jgi:hypothetical protein
MPSLTEEQIRQITERVTREVLAALDVDEPADEYPDWDEFAGEPVAEAVIEREFVPPPPATNSPFRALSKGRLPEPVVVDEPTQVAPAGGTKGAVLSLGDSGATGRRSASGFSPDPWANGDWFVRNFQKDVLNQRRQPPAEDRVTTVRI